MKPPSFAAGLGPGASSHPGSHPGSHSGSHPGTSIRSPVTATATATEQSRSDEEVPDLGFRKILVTSVDTDGITLM